MDSREGDVVADLKTPGYKEGIRIYASVKKSADTVGGQDVPGVIKRLEAGAKAEKNLTPAHIYVFFVMQLPEEGRLDHI